MKILNRGPAETGSAELAKTQETARTERAGLSRTTGSRGGSDRVEVSSLTGRIAQAMQASSTERSERVASLTAQYRAGEYHPDAAAVSRAMVGESLAAASNQ